MSSPSKRKGLSAERELAKLLVSWGITEARRQPLSGALTDFPGDLNIDGHSVEVKRCERAEIWKWLAQVLASARGGRQPLLFFRRNNSRWWVTLDAEHWAREQAELRALRAKRMPFGMGEVTWRPVNSEPITIVTDAEGIPLDSEKGKAA